MFKQPICTFEQLKEGTVQDCIDPATLDAKFHSTYLLVMTNNPRVDALEFDAETPVKRESTIFW